MCRGELNGITCGCASDTTPTPKFETTVGTSSRHVPETETTAWPNERKESSNTNRVRSKSSETMRKTLGKHARKVRLDVVTVEIDGLPPLGKSRILWRLVFVVFGSRHKLYLVH
ncbi:hypothetical protein K438DRAFT_545810 [Mycena galopus ATCC 62051]|nr:hypothetical protein K438DRAFT_545810 [Mycena galopus ATCC 62051]